LSEFFEPPPSPTGPEPPRYRMPPWLGPPRGTLPAVVPLELVLARTDSVAVCVTRLAAFPTGFELDVVTMSASEDPELDPLLFLAPHHVHRGAGTECVPPEMLRVGVQFADGSKATNTRGFHDPEHPPSGPVMHGGGGGGGGGNWQQTFWVWPLPPPGPLVLVCEWPALGIPLTRFEIDAQPILDAATRAQVVFSDAHLPEWPPDDAGPPAASAA
jgi:hypothetical protein